MLDEINVNACFTSEWTMLLLLCPVVNVGAGKPYLAREKYTLNLLYSLLFQWRLATSTGILFEYILKFKQERLLCEIYGEVINVIIWFCQQ